MMGVVFATAVTYRGLTLQMVEWSGLGACSEVARSRVAKITDLPQMVAGSSCSSSLVLFRGALVLSCSGNRFGA
jgi:uncharacterized membrane protein